MKKMIFLLSTVFFSTVVFAQQALPLSHHRVLSYESFKADQPGPVFIFLPGIYRGFSADEEFAKLLKEQDIPFVTIHFAEHPHSVALTGAETPDFSQTDATALADEVRMIAQELKIKKPIPVTLSFSSVVTAHLDTNVFPIVIETSPIGKDTDGLPPAVAAYYEYLRSWMQLFPFYGEVWLKQMKEDQLRKHWGPWIDRYAEQLPILKQPDYRERAIQGYMALSASAEAFDLRKQDFTKGPQRFFILGENEEETRKKIQQEALVIYEKATGHPPSVVVIPGAGHEVPVHQPKAFVDVILQLRKAVSLVIPAPVQ